MTAIISSLIAAALGAALPAAPADAVPGEKPAVMLVAPVPAHAPLPLRELRLRPQADGPEWVLDVRSASLPREARRSGLAEGAWVRAHGQLIAPQRLRVTRLEIVPPAESGAVMAVAGERLEQRDPVRMNATVFLVQPRKGHVIVIDQGNRRHLVRQEDAVVMRRGSSRPVALNRLRPGDDVIVRGEVDPF